MRMVGLEKQKGVHERNQIYMVHILSILFFIRPV